VSINFLKADVAFAPKQKKILKQWMLKIVDLQQFKIEQLDFIFCTDAYLLNINQQFLKHNTFTDIITFDYSMPSKAIPRAIIGEIYISVERVKENAKKFETTFENELHRVVIHGVLHLCGFKDKKTADQLEMRKQEDMALKELERMF
jgi:rRNA maturation RNase YbeY